MTDTKIYISFRADFLSFLKNIKELTLDILHTRHSTGALSSEQKNSQYSMYDPSLKYDFVIVGTGMAALTLGALLAFLGYKICMLEAHDVAGGYAHTFSWGNQNTGIYKFCAQIHYIWGCAPGRVIYEFLKKIGLHEDITFELLGEDAPGYDRMIMPDGKAVFIPYGYEKLVDNIDSVYPGQRHSLKKFTSILSKIQSEVRNLPENIRWHDYFKFTNFLNLIKYRNRTLQDVFDECGLSKEAQAVLIAQAGDFMAPPDELSIFAYAGLFGGYNSGAYYPTKHFNYFVDRLVKFITSHNGCHIFYETPVTKISVEHGKVSHVKSACGRVFKADRYVCNMDPQVAATRLIGIENFPKGFLKPLNYDYSPSGVMVYLGLKGLLDEDLMEQGFGSFNTWQMTQWDMNKTWREQTVGNFKQPWVFMATPTLHTSDRSVVPAGVGGHIMEIETYADFGMFRSLKEEDPKEYAKKKKEVADMLIDFVQANHFPKLREHIATFATGTPTTNEDFCLAPRGNAYGQHLTPENMGLGRLKSDTPFDNLHWCNAASGFPGVHGTVSTGVELFMKLTGDKFFDSRKMPDDDELIYQIRLSSLLKELIQQGE